MQARKVKHSDAEDPDDGVFWMPYVTPFLRSASLDFDDFAPLFWLTNSATLRYRHHVEGVVAIFPWSLWWWQVRQPAETD